MTPGRHATAIRLESIAHDAGRRMQVVVFYPAAASGAAWTLGGLVGATCVAEGQPARPLGPRGCSSRLQQDLLEGVLSSRRDGRPAGGPFPLVLMDGGLRSDALSYFSLGEFLASHGFVVASLPSLPFDDGRPLTLDAAGVAAKVAALERTLDAAAAWADVAIDRTLVAAWSVGGASTAVLAVRSPRVRAVLSLDGALGYDYGPPLVRELTSTSGLQKPVLHITGSLPNPAPVPKTWTFLQSFGNPAWLLTLQGINHTHFAAQAGVIPFAGDRSERGREFWSAHEAMARVSLGFARWALTAEEPATVFEAAARPLIAGVGTLEKF